MISYEQAHKLFSYSPETGLLINLVSRNSRSLVGSEAGTVSKKGYRVVKVNGLVQKTHHIAWLMTYGEYPKYEIDHINGVKNDNKIMNLRDVNHSDNCKNQKLRNTNKSGVNGVHWFKKSNKWRAKICVNYKIISLGLFDTFEAAVTARKSAEERYGFHQNHGR